MSSTPAEAFATELPLFPLDAVLFPGGVLGLKVFEARYLDLVTGCLRRDEPFGVVALRSGDESGGRKPAFEPIGTLAELVDADSDQAGLLSVRCHGTRRFTVDSSRQQADGLWLARTRQIDDDDVLAPPEPMLGTVRALATTIASLQSDKNPARFRTPYRFDDAGWVANRWCEILPISRAAKQKLMELRDPIVRLELVDEFLRSKGVVK